ncbi:TIGR03085 family metal-binding protein [Kitasatospora sp. NPDC050543]|uniref:TIGR03085 family metal-binding protein n=1 Tax=Kitasatospora sp. NPDC050543 TaxID=3364054 RepID=UPI003797B2B4
MSNLARGERERLARLLAAAGPDAPTLCAGWTTRDLAAHLVLRERRVDAAAGIRIKALAGWTARVQADFAARPYEELLRLFRSGPPRLSPFGTSRLDELGNTLEYFVHAEDVRRAVPGWEPQPVPDDVARLLWRRVPLAVRMEGAGRAPVRLELRDPQGQLAEGPRRDAPTVRVTGEPGELVLWALGRGAQSLVDVQGPPQALTALARAVPLPERRP